jgi:hypothetical protein
MAGMVRLPERVPGLHGIHIKRPDFGLNDLRADVGNRWYKFSPNRPHRSMREQCPEWVNHDRVA